MAVMPLAQAGALAPGSGDGYRGGRAPSALIERAASRKAPTPLLGAFTKAFDQLSDPAMRRVVWLSIGTAALVFLALWAAVGYLLVTTALFEMAWLDAAVALLGGLATLVLTWLLFPAVLSGVMGLFLDRVADVVERRHYPMLPPVRDMPILELLGVTGRFLAVLILFNLLILVFLPFPVVFPLVFYAVNGYLLGREYFELVGMRRDDRVRVRALRAVYRGRLFAFGVVMAFLLTVPLLNLVAPVIGTAAMVHLYEAWRHQA
ncbi:MAG: hypothetical protein EA406_01735 [Rhodospirillales bacterium]|nr:MAG: hypothetical protein EA406_01735 [Rhodospirillales bacterium]